MGELVAVLMVLFANGQILETTLMPSRTAVTEAECHAQLKELDALIREYAARVQKSPIVRAIGQCRPVPHQMKAGQET